MKIKANSPHTQELDAKFYFLPPIEAFELLPLESVDPSLNLCVLALASVLLSLSADDDANARLAAVLARSLDRDAIQRFESHDINVRFCIISTG